MRVQEAKLSAVLECMLYNRRKELWRLFPPNVSLVCLQPVVSTKGKYQCIGQYLFLDYILLYSLMNNGFVMTMTKSWKWRPKWRLILSTSPYRPVWQSHLFLSSSWQLDILLRLLPFSKLNQKQLLRSLHCLINNNKLSLSIHNPKDWRNNHRPLWWAKTNNLTNLLITYILENQRIRIAGIATEMDHFPL